MHGVTWLLDQDSCNLVKDSLRMNSPKKMAANFNKYIELFSLNLYLKL